MKFLVVLALIGAASAQTQYVWDLLNPYLNAAEVQALLSNAKAGQDYPNLDQIPQTNFDCSSKKQAGFYADVDAKCQVFHRCDINGNMTSYLCVNTTVFNQITLICDYYFNVDCSKAQSFENFANSRLYSDKPLFDTPPEGYETPQQKQQTADAEVQAAGGQPAAKPAAGGNKKPAAKPAAKGQSSATTKKPAPGGRNLDNNANANQVGLGQGGKTVKPVGRVTPKAAATTTTTAAAEEATTQAAEDTSAASSEDTTAASSEDTSAASSEDTTAAGGDDTTAASSDETSAASADDTTAAAGGDDTSAAASEGGEETTAAGEETTTAAQ